MFQELTEKFQSVFARLKGHKTLTEENIADAVRQVRLALLDADVNYSVAGEFVKRVKEKALGEAVLRSVSPSQQFIKLVHDELTAFMGSEETSLDLNGKGLGRHAVRTSGIGKDDELAPNSRPIFKRRIAIRKFSWRPAIYSALPRSTSSRNWGIRFRFRCCAAKRNRCAEGGSAWPMKKQKPIVMTFSSSIRLDGCIWTMN